MKTVILVLTAAALIGCGGAGEEPVETHVDEPNVHGDLLGCRIGCIAPGPILTPREECIARCTWDEGKCAGACGSDQTCGDGCHHEGLVCISKC